MHKRICNIVIRKLNTVHEVKHADVMNIEYFLLEAFYSSDD
jgi:hypothetical protein